MYLLATKHTERNESMTIRQVDAAGLRCKQSWRHLSVTVDDVDVQSQRQVDSSVLPYVVCSTIGLLSDSCALVLQCNLRFQK